MPLVFASLDGCEPLAETSASRTFWEDGGSVIFLGRSVSNQLKSSQHLCLCFHRTVSSKGRSQDIGNAGLSECLVFSMLRQWWMNPQVICCEVKTIPVLNRIDIFRVNAIPDTVMVVSFRDRKSP